MEKERRHLAVLVALAVVACLALTATACLPQRVCTTRYRYSSTGKILRDRRGRPRTVRVCTLVAAPAPPLAPTTTTTSPPTTLPEAVPAAAAPTDVSVTLGANTMTVRWSADGRAPWYMVQMREAPGGAWTRPGRETYGSDVRALVAELPTVDAPTTFEVKVTPVLDLTTVGPSSTTASFESPRHLGAGRSYSVGAESVVADQARLQAAGLDTFPDGLLSVLPTSTPGEFEFFASQGDAPDGNGGLVGAGIGHTRGVLSDPVGTTVTSRGRIQGLVGSADYVGAGPVWRDAATGAELMLYHREVYETPPKIWSTIGAAWSSDGVTFTDLGEVLSAGIDRGSPRRLPYGTGPGDVSLVVRGDEVLAYFNDNDAFGGMRTAVARSTVAQFRAAASGGPAPVFLKWDGTSFSQPGLGGSFKPLPVPGQNPSVVVDRCRGGLVMVSSTAGLLSSYVTVSTSDDGTFWTTPRTLVGGLPGYRIYSTLLGDSVDQDGSVSTTDGNLSIFSVKFPSQFDFWSSADLRRMTVTNTDTVGGCPLAPLP